MGETVYVRGRKADVLRSVRLVSQVASGQASDVTGGMAQALLTRAGMALLGRIRKAFVDKARGGADEAGLSWPPLARSTIAYSRRHPGVLWPGSKRAPYAPSWMLTEKQRKRWWALNAIGGPAYAWIISKDEGAKTLIGEYGGVQVDILRDTGLLLNSLSPGTASPEQVFRTETGVAIVGTNRKWAATHHRGIPGKLPQRRLWPEPKTWPESWWRDIIEQVHGGLLDIALFLARRHI